MYNCLIIFKTLRQSILKLRLYFAPPYSNTYP